MHAVQASSSLSRKQSLNHRKKWKDSFTFGDNSAQELPVFRLRKRLRSLREKIDFPFVVMAEADLSLVKEPTGLLSDNSVEPLEDPSSVQTEKLSPETKPTCHFFLEGRCRFGARCRNSHPGDTADTSHVEEHKLICKPSELPMSKKPPMKTAEDVISRLLWDHQVPTESFSIGYLDRFLGVVEQPFTAFSWEDLASAGPGVLAIPKHRIHYFKYGTRVVWDKVSRTDDVFGSTGSGITILEVIKEEEEKDQAVKEKNDNHPSNEGGTKDTSAVGQRVAKDSGEEEDVLVSAGEKQLNRTGTGNNEDKETGEAMGSLKLTGDMYVSLDGNTVTEGMETGLVSSAADGKVDEHILGIEEEGEPQTDCLILESGAGKYFPRPNKRPTHFMAIRITSPEILEAVKGFQDALCELRPDLAKFCMPLASLHLTLGLLCLNTPEDIDKAVAALRELQTSRQPLLPPGLLLSFQRVETFFSRVLYLAPAPVPQLGRLAQMLEDVFSKKDLRVVSLPDKEKLHLTMVKISRRKGMPQLPGDLSWIPTIEHLGTQAVETLRLCKCGTSSTDEFYNTVYQIDLY
ncbi:leukocyte receptor cluster member 9 [Anolis carolinensis]|uniref:Leukocyte receptor cluster member 9 n=1 Tax=Anolis carolinensis TaxID=28377 RepID=H9GNQ1_ANOCA|nr:PREDICTED: leukocyte receptor cluster member 9 [Anolis carolinensis]|eukprot:XP_008116682.1 PREDICTED: leukocyte receptor cluster member 9 [Anolis carolinensis]